MNQTHDILLCDLDAFFASVEQRDQPGLRGKPVIVGGSPEGRGVVSTCSYEARQFGIRSAMPMKKALTLCPHAVVLKGRMSRYREVSAQVHRIFEHYTPDIETVSIDEAYLAVSKGRGLAIGKAIHASVKNELDLPISVGVSTNKLLAKIACEQIKPNRVGALWPEQVPESLWPLPVGTLPGIGPVTEKALQSLGIKTIEHLAHTPAAALTGVLGNNCSSILGYARGIDNRKLHPAGETKSISEETTFPSDIYDPELIRGVLFELCAGVGYRLRHSGRAAATLTLKLRFANFRTITRSCSLPEPTDNDRTLYKTAQEIFQNHRGNAPWRLIGVQASGLDEGKQLSITSTLLDREQELLAVRDQLRDKYGSEVLIPARRLKKKK